MAKIDFRTGEEVNVVCGLFGGLSGEYVVGDVDRHPYRYGIKESKTNSIMWCGKDELELANPELPAQGDMLTGVFDEVIQPTKSTRGANHIQCEIEAVIMWEKEDAPPKLLGLFTENQLCAVGYLIFVPTSISEGDYGTPLTFTEGGELMWRDEPGGMASHFVSINDIQGIVYAPITA